MLSSPLVPCRDRTSEGASTGEAGALSWNVGGGQPPPCSFKSSEAR